MRELNELGIFMYALSVLIFNYTGINHEGFIILSVLMVIDTIFGVTKVIARGDKPTSRMLKVGLLGKLSVLCFPLIISLAFKATGREGERIINTSLGLLVWAEAYSAMRNILATRTGKDIEEYDAITVVLTGILGVVKDIIDKHLFRR